MMLHLISLTIFNFSSSPTLLQDSKILTTQSIPVNPSNVNRESIEAAPSLAPASIISPGGYSLRYPTSWQRFITQESNPNSDIFLARSITNKAEGPVATITTTIRDFLMVPRELPKGVTKFSQAAGSYIGILLQTGYKVKDVREFAINGRAAVKVVAETPDKRGSITLLVEGEKEKMVVSTSLYPIDASVVSPQILESIISEIESIQSSITILINK